MTAPAPAPVSARELELDDSWASGAGSPHGGWVWSCAGQLVAQARQLAGHEQP